ncbi:probable cysteine protease RD19B [Salvia miltiorrhiza]|uniref:probable cysteine protease RD19B n=1 Tax=Salvia miltiorrhiza TaxID=226208 RepID=UPI0025AD1EC0|nr:probable cysteine protease RD19B [Salvia miltiorrhiza]
MDLYNDPFFTYADYCWPVVYRDCDFPVRRQRQTRTCYAFSTVDAISASYYMATGQNFRCSEQECLDFFISDAFDYVKQFGLSRDSDYPFLGQWQNVPWTDRLKTVPIGPRIYITDYMRLGGDRKVGRVLEIDHETIRRNLRMMGPLVVGLPVVAEPKIYIAEG